jgi:hypothetical protein
MIVSPKATPGYRASYAGEVEKSIHVAILSFASFSSFCPYSRYFSRKNVDWHKVLT